MIQQKTKRSEIMIKVAFGMLLHDLVSEILAPIILVVLISIIFAILNSD